MSKHEEDYLEWPGVESIKFRSDGLFYGSVDWAETYLASASRVVQTVKESDSIRLCVIETWLLVDDMVRQILISGLDLDKHDHEDLELRYNLLPRSFVGCLDLIDKVYKANESLPEAPKRCDLSMPVEMGMHMRKEHRELWDQMLKVVEDFKEAKHPELKKAREAGSSFMFMPDASVRYRTVSSAWLDAASKIDSAWLAKAKQVNRARNKAAHTHDELAIAQCFGLAGTVEVGSVKRICLDLIDTLLGIIPSTPKGAT